MKKLALISLMIVPALLIRVDAQITLNLKVYLEGSFTGTQMSSSLNVMDYLPYQQPYHQAPWGYDGSESVTGIPNVNIVDWILVEILQPEISGGDTSFVMKAKKAAFISTDGYIKDLDGICMLFFPGLDLTSFHVRIIHRNHLLVTSANPLALSNGIFHYDFTISASQAMGGTLSQKEVAAGTWAMIAGNGDGNSQNDNLDKSDVWYVQKNSEGYYTGDFNMDGQVDNDDKVVKWKSNSGKSSPSVALLVPDNLPPMVPFNPQPPDGSTNQPIATYLTWTCFDPEDDPLTYDILFLTKGQTGEFFDPAASFEYNTTYYWKIIAHDDHGNAAEGPLWTFTTMQVPPWQCGDPFTDPRDNQVYSSVQIGTQCWMAENLNIGTLIPGNYLMMNNSIIEKYCYNDSASSCEEYGGLYSWLEMMEYMIVPGQQGICPPGWHVPSIEQWTEMIDFLGGDYVAGGKLKEIYFNHWKPPNTGATNETGFTALPAGVRNYYGNFNYRGYLTNIWTSSQYDETYALYMQMSYSNALLDSWDCDKLLGHSVRCLKN